MRQPVIGESSARWLLVLCGARGSLTTQVAASVAAYSGAVHLPEHAVGPQCSGRPDEHDRGKERDQRLVAEVARQLNTTDRVVVELSATATARVAQGVPEALADVSGAWQIPLLVVELTTSAVAIERRRSARSAWVSTRPDCRQEAADLDDTQPSWPSEAIGGVAGISTHGLTAEQIAAWLRPVLIGPRRPCDLRQHLERRMSMRSLRGRPVDGHPGTKLISGQLARDGADRRLLDRWWRSTVIDENTDQPVIARETFRWIEQFDKSARGMGWPVSNAGLLHTYGYLMSTAWTPYGWKGDRYFDGTLAALLGVDLDDLTPWARHGTVLANLTVALDRLMASSRPDYLVVETGRFAMASGDVVRGRLRTRIYPRNHTLSERLLVYTVAFSDTGTERYITSFPVGSSGVEAILADEQPRSRFNIAGELLSGSRSVRRP